MKNMELIGDCLDIRSSLKADQLEQLDELADMIAASVLEN